jgi:hypothetical protein
MASFPYALAGVRGWFCFICALNFQCELLSSVHIPLHLFYTSTVLVHMSCLMEKKLTNLAASGCSFRKIYTFVMFENGTTTYAKLC